MTQIIRNRDKPTDTRIERSILTGMIVSKRFLQEIQTIYTPGCLRGTTVRTVAEWCQDYYKHYKKPPKKTIEDIFREQKNNGLEEGLVEGIEELLTGISNEYETGDKFNVDYILDKTEKHFRMSSLENLRKDLSQAIIGGRVEDGEALASGYCRVTRIETVGVDPFLDDRKIFDALDENSGDIMFNLWGALGKTVGQLERGHLMGIIGSQGVGKTWWLMAIALRALFSGYKVLFVSLEMSEKQMIRRIQHWVTGLPSKKWAGDILIPVFDCLKNQTNECKEQCKIRLVDKEDKKPDFHYAPKKYEVCTQCMNKPDYELETWFKKVNKPALDWPEALKKKNVLKRTSMIRPNRFKLVQFPSGKFTMSDFQTYLHNLEYYEEFLPDVVVTDFADKFKREHKDYRHGINQIWEEHKRLAQEKNILVVTGSQSNTARTGSDIKQGSWSEDIRKLGEIDIGFAINQTPEEKQQGFYRCGVIKQRHDEFDLLGEVTVLNQLRIGRPYLSSFYGKKK